MYEALSFGLVELFQPVYRLKLGNCSEYIRERERERERERQIDRAHARAREERAY